jgi:hypothetical protein
LIAALVLATGITAAAAQTQDRKARDESRRGLTPPADSFG